MFPFIYLCGEISILYAGFYLTLHITINTRLKINKIRDRYLQFTFDKNVKKYKNYFIHNDSIIKTINGLIYDPQYILLTKNLK
jgi:hypothetical protein